jgi:peptide/nickel transport system substrate-binding protein
MKKKHILIAVSLLLGCALIGFSSCGGAKKEATNDGVLTIAADAGTSNQFPENFNVNTTSTTGTAPGAALFYETLFRVSAINGGQFIPNLAVGEEFSADGKEVTWHLRPNVKWSDGQPFTAEDVKFTYDQLLDGEHAHKCANIKTCDSDLVKPFEVVDDLTVKGTFNMPKYSIDQNLSMWYPIFPKHVYTQGMTPDKAGYYNFTNYVDRQPVGTGPGKLISFSPQNVKIGIRDDYWGGKSEGVKEVNIIPSGSTGNVQSGITKGQVDWAIGSATGVQTKFPAMNANNRYDYFPSGGSSGIIFSVNLAPVDDVNVRKALRAAVDLQMGAKSVDTGYGIPTITGFDPNYFKNYLISGYEQPLTQDANAAKEFLAQSSYTVENGNLTKNGQSYPLSVYYDSTNDVLSPVNMPVFKQNWKDILGIDVDMKPIATSVYRTTFSRQHSYPMFVDAVVLGGTAVSALQGYSRKNLEVKAQQNFYGNPGMWEVPDAANTALNELGKLPPSATDKIVTDVKVVEQAIIDDAPFIPTSSNGAGVMWSVGKWSNWPVKGESDYKPMIKEDSLNNMVQTVMHVKPASS